MSKVDWSMQNPFFDVINVKYFLFPENIYKQTLLGHFVLWCVCCSNLR